MEKTIRKIIGELLELNLDTMEKISVRDDLCQYGFSSLVAMTLIVHMEDEFNIVIEDEDLLMEKMNTIENLIKVVNME